MSPTPSATPRSEVTERGPALWSTWEAGVQGHFPRSGELKEATCSFKRLGSTIHGGDHLLADGFLQRLVIRPDSKWRLLWDMCSVFVLIADILLIPLMLLPLEENVPFTVVQWSITLFWTFDIVASFLTGYHGLGFVEMRLSKIACRYMRQTFLMDFTCCAVDISMAIVKSAASDLVGIARIGKIARVSRIMRLLRLMRAVKFAKVNQMVKEYIHSETLVTALGVLRTVVGVLVTCHYVACLWYAVARLSADHSDDSWLLGLERSDLGYHYVTALHWSITQFTPASMEVVPRTPIERLFAVCVILLGLVVFSSFLSSITAAMSQLHRKREVRNKQIGDIRRYIVENRLSLNLGSSIMTFLRAYDFSVQNRLHEKDLPVLLVIPESIRVRLRWEIYQPALVHHAMFSHFSTICERGMVEICNTAMSEKHLTLSQELFTADSEATSTDFVFQGVLKYFHGYEERNTREVKEGQWVAEAALWLQWEHRGRLAALTPCELMILSAAAFRRIVVRFPEMHALGCLYAQLYIKRVVGSNTWEPIDTWCEEEHVCEMVRDAIEAYDAFQQESTEMAEHREAWAD